MNSINWGRVLAQIPYYVQAAAQRSGPCDVVVPTGNFGNILAGWYAKRAGAADRAPRRRLATATTSSPGGSSTGDLVAEPVEPTLSPSMDIQVSSNHERLLFELLDRDGAAHRRAAAAGSATSARSRRRRAPEFLAGAGDDAEHPRRDRAAPSTERRLPRRSPHRRRPARRPHASGSARDRPVVCLATAHPAKFPDAVEQATGDAPGAARAPRRPARPAGALRRPARRPRRRARLRARRLRVAAGP